MGLVLPNFFIPFATSMTLVSATLTINKPINKPINRNYQYKNNKYRECLNDSIST